MRRIEKMRGKKTLALTSALVLCFAAQAFAGGQYPTKSADTGSSVSGGGQYPTKSADTGSSVSGKSVMYGKAKSVRSRGVVRRTAKKSIAKKSNVYAYLMGGYHLGEIKAKTILPSDAPGLSYGIPGTPGAPALKEEVSLLVAGPAGPSYFDQAGLLGTGKLVTGSSSSSSTSGNTKQDPVSVQTSFNYGGVHIGVGYKMPFSDNMYLGFELIGDKSFYSNTLSKEITVGKGNSWLAKNKIEGTNIGSIYEVSLFGRDMCASSANEKVGGAQKGNLDDCLPAGFPKGEKVAAYELYNHIGSSDVAKYGDNHTGTKGKAHDEKNLKGSYVGYLTKDNKSKASTKFAREYSLGGAVTLNFAMRGMSLYLMGGVSVDNYSLSLTEVYIDDTEATGSASAWVSSYRFGGGAKVGIGENVSLRGDMYISKPISPWKPELEMTGGTGDAQYAVKRGAYELYPEDVVVRIGVEVAM